MTQPKLTIGMATYDDFYGVHMTIQALRLYQDIADCEILVIDNNPASDHAEAVRGLLANSQDGRTPMRYVPFVESTGTTQTRERIFSEAHGEAVLVMDCHVMLAPNAIHYLKKFYAEADTQMQKNLFTGPLLMDNLSSHQTHFEPEWRDQMWGIWATTWISPDGAYMVGRETPDHNLEMKVLNTDGPWQAMSLPWPSHEKALMEQGYRLAGWGSDTDMFEIPAQGLGLFSSVKEHWLGFNPHFRSFGGEECYIHEKYRQAGRKTFCLPFLKWNHRFGRPGGPEYPITVEGKMRNYILGFQELGLDLEPVRKHFVDEVGVSPQVWEYALQDPVSYVPGQAYGQRPENDVPSLPVATSNLGLPLPAVAASVADVSGFLRESAKRDLDEHAPTLIALASRCNKVIEITGRRESTAFLLHGVSSLSACEKQACEGSECSGACKQARQFHSFQGESDTLSGILQSIVEDGGIDREVDFRVTTVKVDDYPELPFEPDLLFLDLRHSAESVKSELSKYAPSVGRYIIFHDTVIHGQHGDDGGKGMLYGLRDFLRDNPEWFVAWHNHQQYGLTVLGRLPEDKPQEPIRPWPPMDGEGKLCGCGQSLKASLKLIGIEASENCSCNARAAQMDVWGPDLCRENIETILDWLKEQAEGRQMGHLFVRPVVKLMVLRAIKSAEKQIKAGNCY